MRWLIVLALAVASHGVQAQDLASPDHRAIAARVVDGHVLPAYQALSDAAGALRAPAKACDADALRDAYHSAFDAWMGAQHIAFGPVEDEMRRFAIAFWPDAKGFTRKAITRLVSNEDPVVDDAEAFAKVSVAARGLLALEWVLYDENGERALQPDYSCRLAQAIARDLSTSASAVLNAWEGNAGFARTMRSPGPANPLYPDAPDVTRDVFTALDGGLQALIDLRLGRPLGSFERPRPKRAEAWRSGRSLRNIEVSLLALNALYSDAFAPELSEEQSGAINAALDRSLMLIDRAPRPMTDTVSAPRTRVQIEAIQSQLVELQRRLREVLAPALGVTLGFNALDGD